MLNDGMRMQWANFKIRKTVQEKCHSKNVLVSLRNKQHEKVEWGLLEIKRLQKDGKQM